MLAFIFPHLRRDIRRLPHVTRAMIAAMALYMFGWGFIDPFFSLYLESFGKQYETIGWLSSIIMIAALCVLILLGSILDYVSHKQLLFIAKCAYGVVGVLYVFAGVFHSFPLLILALVCNGIFMPVVWATTEATLRDHSAKENAALVFGVYYVAIDMAFAFGLAGALILVAHIPLAFLFIAPAVCAPLSLLFGRHVRHRHHARLFDVVRLTFRKNIFHRWIVEIRHWNRFRTIGHVVIFFNSCLLVFLFSFFPLYLESRSFSFVFIGVVAILLRFPPFVTLSIIEHARSMRNIAFGFMLSSIMLLLLPIFSHVAVTVIFALVMSLGVSVVLPSTNGLLTTHTKTLSQGMESATAYGVELLGIMIFQPLIGFCIDHVGWSATFIIVGILIACCALGVALFMIMGISRNVSLPVSLSHSRRRYSL